VGSNLLAGADCYCTGWAPTGVIELKGIFLARWSPRRYPVTSRHVNWTGNTKNRPNLLEPKSQRKRLRIKQFGLFFRVYSVQSVHAPLVHRFQPSYACAGIMIGRINAQTVDMHFADVVRKSRSGKLSRSLAEYVSGQRPVSQPVPVAAATGEETPASHRICGPQGDFPR